MSAEKYQAIRDAIKITNPEQLYQIKDRNGNIIDLGKASGQELADHYLHRLTNYKEIINNLRAEQGHVSKEQEERLIVAAKEKILQFYRDEHLKVVQEAQTRGNIIKQLLQKVGVGTAAALTQTLDAWSAKIKEISHLESSQRSLQTWNDTYRVQRELVKELLKQNNVSPEIIEQVNQIYGTRSVNKAVDIGCQLFNWEESETIKLIKSAVRYSKIKSEK